MSGAGEDLAPSTNNKDDLGHPSPVRAARLQPKKRGRIGGVLEHGGAPKDFGSIEPPRTGTVARGPLGASPIPSLVPPAGGVARLCRVPPPPFPAHVDTRATHEKLADVALRSCVAAEISRASVAALARRPRPRAVVPQPSAGDDFSCFKNLKGMKA